MVNADDIKKYAAELLEQGKVKGVLGYQKGTAGVMAQPCMITEAGQAEQLVWDPTCLHNLALYLVKDSKDQAESKTPDKRPLGIVAKGCDSRAVVVLLQENYFRREDVVIIGVSCENGGVVDPRKLSTALKGKAATAIEFDGKDTFKVHTFAGDRTIPARDILADRCLECRQAFPNVADVSFGDKVEERGYDEAFRAVKAAQQASEDERWDAWSHHFDRCLRCFACRSVCPMCYCPECVVDSTAFMIAPETTAEDKANRIKWIERSATTSESAVYHLTRAIHLAGRCIDCGECERVCPVNIPLRLLNTKLELDAFEMFEYQAGRDPEQASLMSSFRDEDPNSFIR